MNHRGFASVMAVSMIALISMVVVLMATKARDVTLDAAADRRATQLRQMLITGAAASQAMLSEGREEAEVKLPITLTARGAKLTVRLNAKSGELEKSVAVAATLDGQTMKQALRYVKTQIGWGLAEAKLE